MVTTRTVNFLVNIHSACTLLLQFSPNVWRYLSMITDENSYPIGKCCAVLIAVSVSHAVFVDDFVISCNCFQMAVLIMTSIIYVADSFC